MRAQPGPWFSSSSSLIAAHLPPGRERRIGLDDAAQVFQAALPRRPDRADRHGEGVGHLAVLGGGEAMSTRSSRRHRSPRTENALHTARSRSSRRRAVSTGGRGRRRAEVRRRKWGSRGPTDAAPGGTRAARSASHPGSRSASLIRSRFSTSRNHVICTASAASSSGNRYPRAIDHTRLEKSDTRSSQAACSRPAERPRGALSCSPSSRLLALPIMAERRGRRQGSQIRGGVPPV